MAPKYSVWSVAYESTGQSDSLLHIKKLDIVENLLLEDTLI